jgi:hypothetical protein
MPCATASSFEAHLHVVIAWLVTWQKKLDAMDLGVELGATDHGVDPLNTYQPAARVPLCSRASLPRRLRAPPARGRRLLAALPFLPLLAACPAPPRTWRACPGPAPGAAPYLGPRRAGRPRVCGFASPRDAPRSVGGHALPRSVGGQPAHTRGSALRRAAPSILGNF